MLGTMNQFFAHYATCRPSWNPAWTVLTTLVDDATRTQQFAAATPITGGQVLINWGDGTPDTPELAHTYTKNGEYTVLIKNCSNFNAAKQLNLNTAVQLGTDIESGEEMFNSSPIREIKNTFYPSVPMKGLWMFASTKNLHSLPENFKFLPGNMDYRFIFQKSAVGIFSSHIFPREHVLLSSAFNSNTGLKIISKDLNLQGGGSFTFYNSQIENVEPGFKLQNMTDIRSYFALCKKFKADIGAMIDENSFTTNANLTSTFANSAITGTAPANLLWLDKTPGKWKATTDCFLNCTGLTNYNDIPQSWGGPHAEY